MVLWKNKVILQQYNLHQIGHKNEVVILTMGDDKEIYNTI